MRVIFPNYLIKDFNVVISYFLFSKAIQTHSINIISRCITSICMKKSVHYNRVLYHTVVTPLHLCLTSSNLASWALVDELHLSKRQLKKTTCCLS